MINQNYRILHLEDLPSDAGLAEREIAKVLKHYSIMVVETEADFIDALASFDPHIVVSDFKLPSFDGMSALKIVLEKAPLTPVIVLTGSMNEDTAVYCLKAGAVDYVIKEHIKRLGPAVINALKQKKVKAEKAKALQEIKLLSKSIEQSPVTVVITDPLGNIEYVNPMFSVLTGYTQDEVSGRNMRILKSGKQSAAFYENMWEVISSGMDWSGEMQNKRKNGELYWENVNISSILDDNGRVLHFVGVKENITERKQILEELIVAKEKAEESDRLKTAFLHNISHEIRTPMNAIIGFSNLLTQSVINPDKFKHYTDIIVKSSNQLLSIITDIVNIATIESGQEQVKDKDVHLNNVIQLLYEQFRQAADKQGLIFSYRLGLPEKDAIITTDNTKLVEVLTNLLTNALKFTHKGSVEFGYNKSGDMLQFFVKDTGIGIPEIMHAQIFERFRQVDRNLSHLYGGSGLGLAISKGYVELLGGKIWLESVPEKGSSFYFTLPFVQPNINISQNNNATIKKEGVSFSNVTLLIAEDEDTNFYLLEEMLAPLQLTIIRAVNGEEAVSICKENAAVNLVLMDLKMPVMDGFEASRAIVKMNPNIPIIAQTAFSSELDREKALECGCSDFISKPLILNQLLEKMEFLITK